MKTENITPAGFLKVYRELLYTTEDSVLEYPEYLLLYKYLQEAGENPPVSAEGGPNWIYSAWRKVDILPDPGKDIVVWQLINNIGIPIFDEAVKIYFELDD